MDGNRRWALEKGLPLFEGHNHGEECIEPIVDEAIALGITHLTFWAFSTENWKRSQDEVKMLLTLFRRRLDKRVNRFHEKNVRVRVIGDIAAFPKDIQKKVAGWLDKTKDNTRLTVNFALSYGGRDEITRAIRKLTADSYQPSAITQEIFSKYLDTVGQPDPDLMIRTGGDRRLSGFLLWQLEYAELYFTDTYWPDFTPLRFREAIQDCSTRQRRFGR